MNGNNNINLECSQNIASLLNLQNIDLSSGEATPFQELYLDLLGSLTEPEGHVMTRGRKPMKGLAPLLNLVTAAMSPKKTKETHMSKPFSQSEARIHEIHQPSQPMPRTAATTLAQPPHRACSAPGPGPYSILTTETVKPFHQHEKFEGHVPLPAARDKSPACELNSFGEGDDGDSKFESLPCGIEEHLKDDDAGFPENAEVDSVIERSPSLESQRSVTETGVASVEVPDEPSSSGSGIITKIFNNIVGVAYHCCEDFATPGGICQYCSRSVLNESDSTCKCNTENPLHLKAAKSEYYDCTTGEDEEHLWSSPSASEDESNSEGDRNSSSA